MTSTEILLVVDIGGTFTNIVALDTTTQKIAVEKILCIYPRLRLENEALTGSC